MSIATPAPSARPRIFRSLADSRPRLLVASLAFVVAACYVRQFAIRLGDPDLWGRLAVGKLFFARGGMPKTDPFAYTPTLPRWIDHEWLTGVVFYVIDLWTGEPGLLLLKTLLGLAAVGFAIAVGRQNGARMLPLVICAILALPVFGYGMLPRAQLFTYFFFALWLFLLERLRRGGSNWLLLAFPLTIIPWANLHGGFLAGLGLLALYVAGLAIAGQPFVKLAITAALCGAATLINPYGFEYWRYLIPAVRMERPDVAEWAAVPFALSYLQFWILAALTVGALRMARRDWRARAPQLIVLAVVLVLSVRHARHMPLFALAALAYLPAIWQPTVDRLHFSPSRRYGRLDLVLFPALLLAGLWQLRGAIDDGPLRWELPSQNVGVANMVVYPVAAVDFAREHNLRGNLAVPFNWGEYAIWRLPNCPVSLDGRYETVYPPSTVELVESFFAGKANWSRLIDDFPTDLVLAPADSPANARLQALGWKRLYADTTASLWSRR